MNILQRTPDIAPTPEIIPGKVIEITDLEEFACRSGSSKQAAYTLWNRLQAEYERKELHPVEDPCPVEFHNDPAQAPTRTGRRHHYRFLEVDTLIPTALWLQNPRHNTGRHRLGDTSRGLLSHYINECLEPEEPIFLTSPLHMPVIIPPPESFEPNELSPYVDYVQVEGKPTALVTVDSLARFATRELGFDAERDIENLEALLRNVAIILNANDADKVTDQYVVPPKSFVEIVHEGLKGKLEIAKLRGKKTRYTAIRYMGAIARN